MSTYVKNSMPGIFLLVLGLFISTSGNAWYGGSIAIGFTGGNVHYYGDGYNRAYGPWNYGYYDRDYYYNGGQNIIVPNVIIPNVVINVPVQRYYVPVCEEMEVCDPYGQCWLEQFCR